MVKKNVFAYSVAARNKTSCWADVEFNVRIEKEEYAFG